MTTQRETTLPLMLDAERSKYINREIKYEERIAELTAQNAALEMMVAQLLKAIETYFEPTLDLWKRESVMRKALSTPFSPTALSELVEKAKSEQSSFDNQLFMKERERRDRVVADAVEKLTIERCAEFQQLVSENRHGYDKHRDSEAIRALPIGNIDLKELLNGHE